MKKRILITVLIAAVCLLAAAPALAADVFKYAERNIRIFEDEEATPVIEQDGKYADGEIIYTSSNPKAATVSAGGTITPVAKGKTTVTAQLVRDGKNIRRTTIEVTVVRRVTKVTLSRKNLIVLEPDDPLIEGLLAVPETDENDPEPVPDETAELPVIVVPTGRNYTLKAVCTPEDANNTKVSFATTDVGVAKINSGTTLRGVEKGECLLTAASVQNPEITELYRVLVVEPVKKIKIESPSKSIFVGESMELDAAITPDTASIRRVTWTSRKPSVAVIDESGVVTGIAKGQATIEARSLDGTDVVATFTLNVEQDAAEITVKPAEVTVATRRRTTVTATVLPKEANNRRVKWVSSDESVATVRNGEITGVKAGGCVVTAISESNPSVLATVQVTVVQPVTQITFTGGKVSLPVQTSAQLYWNVEPADASIKDVTFKSSNTGIATVDANGLVTGHKRGTVTITAAATDGSRKTGTVKVEVIQPAEGVMMERGLYYVPLGRGANIKATVLPSDANNKNVYWEISDPSVASIRSNGTSTGRATGIRTGTATVTAITEDGGYTATAAIQVSDFDGAIRTEGLEITPDNRIRLSLWNASDLMIEKVYFRINCFDTQNYPMIYNRDGVSTGFNGEYPLPLYPGERTIHGQFDFGDFLDTGTLGAVTLTVTGYRFENGQYWEIPEEYQITTTVYSQHMWEPTPAPLLPADPEPTPAP